MIKCAARLLLPSLFLGLVLPAAAGDVTATLEASRARVYIGEPFELTLVIDCEGVQLGRQVDLTGLPEPAKVQLGAFRELQTERRVDGSLIHEIRRYRSTARAVSAGTVLFRPTLDVRVQNVQRTPFGQHIFERAHRLLVAPVELTVLDVPVEGRPAAWSGLIGNLEFDASLSSTNVVVGELITATLAIRGLADYTRLTPPRIESAPGLKLYEPKLRETDSDRERVFDQILIPQSTNATVVPAVSFCWFDPVRERFTTATRGPFRLRFRAQEAETFEPYRPTLPSREEQSEISGAAAAVPAALKPWPAAPDIADAVARAGESVADGYYDAAVDACAETLSVRPRDAALRHNMGVCLLRAGKPGPAALWLRRALLLAPGDAATREALGLAERCGGAGPARGDPLQGWSGRLTAAAWARTALALGVLLALCLALRAARRLPSLPADLLALALLATLAGATAAMWRHHTALRQGAVILVTETARLAPADQAEQTFSLPSGAYVRVLDLHEGWARVRAGQNTGWVPANRIERIVPHPSSMTTQM